ncbi:MAG: error-prone DNA polymerase [Luteibacter sp.]|uniref:error-prone DNA polymerase n=1 Tax=Luteibacter sp. TaxID=1886636 RepID=UPI002807376C|nr:error-prone DNA polymerase [Luteibacter sp.]MDQ7997940.1 error-prone DNA polymerase [Luteibacter sp.]MDQ8050102.1 error-prone DNA polymerase [Luteibacter sp.]
MLPLVLPLPANDGDVDVPAYAELHALSDFSFQRGASSARELFERAREIGYTALAITDECSLSGIVRGLEASLEVGLPMIVGSEFRLSDGTVIVLLVENQDGYTELCRLITLGRRRATKGHYELHRADLENLADGLCLLWAPGPLAATGMATHESRAAWVATHFKSRAWLAVELHRSQHDEAELAALRDLAARHALPCVAAGDVHMHLRRRRALQDVMTAIRLNRTVAEAGHDLFPNGERHLRRRETLDRIYPRDMLDETAVVAARCIGFDIRKINYVYPRELVPEGKDPAAWLRQLTYEGAALRWPDGVASALVERIEKELDLIARQRYEAFFLTVQDIVRFARSRGILCQGRGSAANSVVCFCLHITEVNPDQITTLFERFISLERDEPPDIDVDFEHERREEVLQYVFDKYSRERAALAATVISYRPKSAARDVGRALGLSEDQLDQLSHAYSHAHGEVSIIQRLQERGFDIASRTIRQLVVLVQELSGMPRHLSQHVGGFVISDTPLHYLVPVENAAMDNRTIIQWDKDDLETMKLLKVDCLALGMLTCMRKAIDMLRTHCGIDYRRLADIPMDDGPTYAMIQRADTVGVFQIESRAQMSMLPRLKPACYYDLVIQVAIVRPGPIQGGMVHPYLQRRQMPSGEIHYEHGVRPVLERTLGVPIFQEQVMAILQVVADFSPGESDDLRRSMAAWKRRGGLQKFEPKIRRNMAKNNYTPEFTQQIIDQIQGFGSYGFPESHAAGFALIAYASSYLKCHHPEIFCCALLNSQPMGFYAPAQLVADLRRHGFEVRPPDVTTSHWDCTLEPWKDDRFALRLGLRQIAGLSADLGARIVSAREASPLRDLADLARRAGLNRFERERLADAGALRVLSGHRHRARWESSGIERTLPLLDTVAEEHATLRPPTTAENVFADYATVGLSLTAHPLGLIRKNLQARRVRRARDLEGERNGIWLRHAGLVTVRQRPQTASGITFVTLEDETGQVNVIVRPRVAEACRQALLDAVLLAVDGQWQSIEGVRHLVASRLHDFSDLLPQLGSVSRDFH